jgi:DNA-binding NtrC family response regulator
VSPIRKRLLFVDDERGIRETLSLILLRHGFTVTIAATVQQALQQIEAQEFDLLLCDLNIEQKRDGYTVVRAMREVHPRCVTIILTGYPDMESAIEGIHLGVVDYITKPRNADELVAILAEKLTAKQLAKS